MLEMFFFFLLERNLIHGAVAGSFNFLLFSEHLPHLAVIS